MFKHTTLCPRSRLFLKYWRKCLVAFSSIIKNKQLTKKMTDKKFTCSNCGKVVHFVVNFVGASGEEIELCEECLEDSE